MTVLRKAAIVLSMIVTGVLSTTGAVSAASPPPEQHNPGLVASYPSDDYPVLDWDHCRNNTGNYMYVEAHTSRCGSQWPTNVWSFSFVGYPSSFGVNKLEVCHSGYHSGTTVMIYGDDNGTHTLSDAAGGGCAIAYGYDVWYFEVDWGTQTGPFINDL